MESAEQEKKRNEDRLLREEDLKQDIRTKEITSYFGYGFAQCISFGLVGTYIMYFYTDILGISAAAASIIFLIARTWDAVNDPLMASFVDTLNSKHGKFRPFLKFMPFLIALSTISLFLPLDHLSMTAKVIYAGAAYIIWGMIYTLSDVPYWSLSSVMTQESKQRTKLITFANMGIFTGIALSPTVFVPMTEVLGGGDEEQGYFLATVVLMLVAVPIMLNGFKNTKERVKPPKTKVKFSDGVRAIRANKPMFAILIVFFLNVFMNITQAMIIYFFTYNLGNAALMSIFGILSFASVIGFFVIPKLTVYFKKKHLLMTIVAVDVIVRIIWFSLGYSSTAVSLTFIGITMLLYTSTGPLISAMLAETIEYTEWKTGKRNEAVVFSGQTFTGKLSVAVSGGAVGLILTAINYQPNQAQTDFTLNMLFFVIALLPAVGSLLRLIIMYFHFYTEKEYNEILDKLYDRRQQEEAQTET
ncbi:MFS transporter [Salisediminibacterium halotolerans]|uniref:Sugar (Glycoside-Pentoside-Hexuronide) transporter n=1 Tax=Salisediminibacterium halotolerans TaxID=517425 RepID=A0A1H9U9I6_9BACI|nr:MFS transporter [Salisediminibacterium haloalkalitolerans]SES05888.1 sugar (Glycoside-Pentoside-Hexuronide) transporter [Salisediminibacterium haloalkalitolerans]